MALGYVPPRGTYITSSNNEIGSELSGNYSNDLGILNAELYDDGRKSTTGLDKRHMSLNQVQNTSMPFGMTEHPRIPMDSERKASGEEHEKGTKRKKKRGVAPRNEEDEEEARKKSRGRPRVDTKDETPADVSLENE